MFINLNSKDNKVRLKALEELMKITSEKVDWIYDKWNILVDKLDSENSYQRSIGMFLLSNLTKSDIENKFFSIMERYLGLMEDDKFITARQSIQNSWKVAIVSNKHGKLIIDHLEKMFVSNKHLAKHSNLIRQDIMSSLVKSYDNSKNEETLNLINMLIQLENDKKVKKSLEKIKNALE